MDFPPEVLSNLHVLNVQHLRSLEQGQDILANHPRLEDSGSGEPPRKKVAASSETDAGNDTVNGSSAAPATKPMRMSLREQSVAAYEQLGKEKCDGLIIVCKQHPSALLMFLSKVSSLFFFLI